MTSKIIRNRISQAALYILLGVAFVASLPSTIEAANGVRGQPLRRLSESRVRGARQHLGTIKKGTEGSGDKQTSKQKAGRNTPLLKNVQRPVAKAFDKLNIKGALQKPAKPEKQLPEPEVTKINVKKGSGSSRRPSKNPDDLVATTEIVENGTEHFTEVNVEVYQRELPPLSIKFEIDHSSTSGSPTMGDYNELSDVAEEYLDGFLKTVFEDVPVRHDDTKLFITVSDEDQYTVEFKLVLDFLIPGEVPTINFLIDQLREGLETETSQLFFISKLETMSETNPFSGTEKYNVVSRPPMSAAEIAGGGRKPQVNTVENTGKHYILASVLAGMGCVVLVGAGLLWRNKHSAESSTPVSGQKFSLFDKSRKNDDSSGANSTGLYGVDTETMSYLKSLRLRYSKDRDDKTPSLSPKSNIAAVEHDDGEESLCDSVNSGSGLERVDIM